jgi:hypothetical protein
MREEKQIPKDHLDKGITLKCICIYKQVYTECVCACVCVCREHVKHTVLAQDKNITVRFVTW